jgi:hypothetical protein
MLRIFLIILLLTPLAGFGQSIYRTTDKDGNVVYTDAPPSGTNTTEEVKLPPTNTAPPPPDIPRPKEPEPTDSAVAYEVAITSPANESTIAMGPGNFSVSASVKPGLSKGQTLQLFMDGEAQGEPQKGTSWNLTNVFRGGHDLTVNLLDREGQVIASSDAVRVYVLRPSINYPNRARPSTN